MKEDETTPEFSLLGGPLHRLGCRLGLVRGGTNTVRLGVALGLLAWGVLVLLTLLRGASQKVFSLDVIGVHVRLLAAIPLFFLCETWVFPRMAEFVRNIVRSDLVPEAELPALASDIRRVNRLNDSWLAEVFFLLAAIALPLIGTIVDLPGRTADWASLLAESDLEVTGVGSVSTDKDLVDPILVVRPSIPICPSKIEGLRFNPTLAIGGGGDSDLVYELYPQLQYQVTENIAARVGYRRVGYQFKGENNDDNELNIALAGLIVGVGVTF